MTIKTGSKHEVAMAIYERLDKNGQLTEGMIGGVLDAARELDPHFDAEGDALTVLAVIVKSSWVSGFCAALRMQEQGVLGNVHPEAN